MSWLSAHLLIILGWLLAVPAAVHMLSQRRTPQSVRAWLVLMFTFPWLGVPLYLMLGGRKMRQLMESKADLELKATTSQPEIKSRVHKVLSSLGIPQAEAGNFVSLHADGEAAFDELLRATDSAERSVWYSTFLFSEDSTGREILDRLVAKAKAGVDVRLLLDGVGSLHTSRQFLKPFVDAGGRVAWFMPVLHRPFRGRTNLRNHRKQVIVDGDHVWAGGRNTADEYMGSESSAERWVDRSYSLTGPGRRVFAQVFQSDWQFATGERLEISDRLVEAHGDETTQVIPSGPDVPNNALLSALLTAAFDSHTRIWLVTPYFVPPDSVTDALCLAARRHVDVRIIIPGRSNHRLADWARGPHLRAIIEAGGRVLSYPRMIHAKTAVFDSSLALVGSANLDERSLLLNYELVLAVYSESGISDTATWINDRAGQCIVWTSTPGRTRTVVEALAETVAPML